MAGRILVLDDEENYAEMLQGLLKKHHFLVDMATKPELALEALEERNYSLVISDYKMPIMDGAVFLKKAREIFPDLPVILVSGLMNTPELVKVANMGVTLVLEKPLDTGYFLEQVKHFTQPMTEEEEAASKEGGQPAESASQHIRPPKKTFDYPRDLHFLADENLASKRYIQETWDQFQEHPQLFFTGPLGCEFELILKELTHWKGEDGRKNLYFSVGQLRKDSVQQNLDSLGDDSENSTVVALGDLSALSIDEQSWLHELIKNEKGLPGGGKLTFVYWIDNLKALSMDLQIYLRNQLIKVPPLSARPGDIAIYSKHFLKEFSEEQGRQDPPEFSGAAMNLLLHYPWKENFSQLLKVLKKSIQVRTSEPLPYEALRSILISLDDKVKVPLEAVNLEEFLILKQQAFLEKHAAQHNLNSREVLSRLGFDVSGMPEGMGIDQLDLLYPELLEPSQKN